jgi:hypothetical protein
MPVLGSQTVREPLASRLLFPLVERAFTYRRYDAWLETLAGPNVVPLRELERAETPALGLRHDVDDRLESAVEFARLEHARGIRSTYFILHTAPYYRRSASFLPTLRLLQDELGHEIGWHNDLLTLHFLYGVDVGSYLSSELEWLRSGGIDIRGTAAHGSPHSHSLGYHNNYLFRGWDELVAGRDRTEVPKLDPADFGLEYEAYHLSYDRYFSDSAFDARGRRAHPDTFDARALRTDEKAVALVHPCHWDASQIAKAKRLAGRIFRRALRAATRAPAVPPVPRR